MIQLVISDRCYTTVDLNSMTYSTFLMRTHCVMNEGQYFKSGQGALVLTFNSKTRRIFPTYNVSLFCVT